MLDASKREAAEVRANHRSALGTPPHGKCVIRQTYRVVESVARKDAYGIYVEASLLKSCVIMRHAELRGGETRKRRTRLARTK